MGYRPVRAVDPSAASREWADGYNLALQLHREDLARWRALTLADKTWLRDQLAVVGLDLSHIEPRPPNPGMRFRR